MHNKFVKYELNRKVFERVLRERGFNNHLDFCKKAKLHRNTLNYYLSGKDVFSKKLYDISRTLEIDPIALIAPVEDGVQDVKEIDFIIKELSIDKDVAVLLLGSRARGEAMRFSDWDIGITGGEKNVGEREYLRLKGRINEIADNLPRKVDLINLDFAPDWFLEEINYEPVFLGGDEKSFHYFKGVLNGIKKNKINEVA